VIRMDVIMCGEVSGCRLGFQVRLVSCDLFGYRGAGRRLVGIVGIMRMKCLVS